MYRRIIFSVLPLFILMILSCKKNKEIDADINGCVQKGPYINGTTINLYELKGDLTQTGNVYNSQIENNSGLFTLNSVQLTSSYVKLEANGYYFNEVLGVNSDGPLTLYALSDISNKTTLNVNIITYLEKARVEYLMSQGLFFNIAKFHAQQEIFHIFNISNAQFQESELFDIMQTGDGNAALLAVSSIIQGYRNTADLSQLLADMITDFKTDGTIDDAIIQTKLLSHIKVANLNKIRTNLSNYYSQIGLSSSVIPDFESYVQQFVDSCNFIFINPFTFPDTDNQGLPNILSSNNNDFNSLTTSQGQAMYSIVSNFPKGMKITIDCGDGHNIFTSTSMSESLSEIYCFDPPGSTRIIKVYLNDNTVPYMTKEIIAN